MGRPRGSKNKKKRAGQSDRRPSTRSTNAHTKGRKRQRTRNVEACKRFRNSKKKMLVQSTESERVTLHISSDAELRSEETHDPLRDAHRRIDTWVNEVTWEPPADNCV